MTKNTFSPFLVLGSARTDVISSLCANGRMFSIDFPLAVRLPSGTSYILVWYTLPKDEKNSRSSWVLAERKTLTTSSSLTSAPIKPLPPLFCRRYSSGLTRFMYPPLVSTITCSASGIKSSALKVLTACVITLVLRSPPYLFLISSSSFLMTASIFLGSFKRVFRSLISFCFSFSSSALFCRFAVSRRPYCFYNGINMVQSPFKSFQNMRPVFGFREIEFGPALDDHLPMFQEFFEKTFKRKYLWLYSVDQSQHVEMVNPLEVGVFI